MADYSYETEIDVRLRDIDFMGHVNNAVYATYLEQAREAYFRDVLGISLEETTTVLVSLEIEYERPIEADETVTVALCASDLGESSLPMAYEIRADGKRAATARTVQVLAEPDGDGSRSIPDEWRRRIENRRD
ncbi:acyl-CoA thioesterase [Natrinema thermotolerans]|uniref:Acyl-CoA thioesterase n=1 Tax=Natrinema thermotolerans TaxID=121872 RepID=A0AAF0PDK6_9EURY|nr:thioesterase family protein [Natrinema thermotolerans]QCC57588.1 acyl-CoA thioesterase [Natrinema thermotolerans]WMT08666.1 acyl-CoA thioesterase [Natrinema thermotolerans]